jgi:amino acid adenylation domain-containing protein
VRALARSLGVTLFALTQSAFSLLISLWSNEQKVVVGTPVANRTHKEVEQMVGFFVNTVPLYCEIDPNESFASFVTKNSLLIKQCLGNQGIPFDLLVDRLKLVRVESKNPLFQIVFALQDLKDTRLVLDGVSVTPIGIASQGAKFDLNVQLFEHADGLSINWEYSSDLFDDAFIQRISASYMALLDELSMRHDAPMKQLKYMPEDEYARIMALSNQQHGVPNAVEFIHRRFEDMVSKYPDRVALSANGEELTYAELNQRANKVAHFLVAHGVKANQLVGLSFHRNTQLVVAILAILKAGAAYVPFDPAIPDERFNFIIEDSKIDVMLTESELTNRFNARALNLIVLDRANEVADCPGTNLQLPSGLSSFDSLAYVIYTSGTTGKPKGVLVSHSNVVRLLDTSQVHYQFNERDRWSLFHSSAFDVSVWEIWGALFYGGCVVVVPRETARSTELFYQFVHDEKITVLSQTPSAFYVFDALDALNRSALTLRYVVFAGEALEFQKLQGWFSRRGDRTPAMINMYGITETTVHSTFKQVMHTDLAIRSSNIGRPLKDLSVYVCNAWCQLVPLGTPGELLIGGAGVTHGYLGRPELTAERFIDNHFDAQAGANKLYRSGDLVRFLASGDMEYLGRIDKQVKLRGYRIELGEIEHQLRLIEGVDDAAVLLQRDDAGEALLAGYLQTQMPENQEGALVERVRNRISQHLPEYMVPAYFICLPGFPITSNGKLDAQSLLKIRRKSIVPHDLVPAAEGLERQIAQIWALELGLEQVGATSNFFELGGNSLKIVALAAKLSNELNQMVTPVTLLRNPTVRQLAGALGQSDTASIGTDRHDTKLTQASRKDLMKKKLERAKK